MNSPRRRRIPRAILVVLAATLGSLAAHAGAKPEVIRFESRALAGNPLQDPDERSVAVFLPTQVTNNTPLPVVYYLPGFGFSFDRFMPGAASWQRLTQKIADGVAPVLLVVVDGRNRWGGSQYLNSPAQGRHEDYVCDEIVAQVEAKHPVPSGGMRRIIAGHSSGGFGALRLAMAHTNLFDAVVALGPDSAFNISHLPFAKASVVARLKPAGAERLAGPGVAAPKDGELNYHLALSAAYAPRTGSTNGAFEWLYDTDGKFRAEVWQRWLDNDPLTLVEKNPRAFAPGVAVYLEGPAQDQFSANIGARKIFEVVHANQARCVFYEPPGRHSDRVLERLQRGLAWVFNRPLTDIKPKE